MVANSLPADPLPARPLGDGVNRSKFNFFREWSGCLQIKWNHKMQQHGSKYFSIRPPPMPLTLGEWGQ